MIKAHPRHSCRTHFSLPLQVVARPLTHRYLTRLDDSPSLFSNFSNAANIPPGYLSIHPAVDSALRLAASRLTHTFPTPDLTHSSLSRCQEKNPPSPSPLPLATYSILLSACVRIFHLPPPFLPASNSGSIDRRGAPSAVTRRLAPPQTPNRPGLACAKGSLQFARARLF